MEGKSMKYPGLRKVILVLLILQFTSPSSHAQYFGRNKPSYRTFEFDVVATPHFEIYHYFEGDSLTNTLSQWTEEWYSIHQKMFKDTFNQKNPVIFYPNHADFQQTTAISSSIGTTTGGVTESLKNRVIMPVAPTLAQTDHVLGHELVHAFQYHKFLKADSAKNYSLNLIPLWMIEGMAEYFSIGSVDPNTAMWMRDALINNDFPTIKQLSTSGKYFPYRYGHAFWAMIGKTWGDTLIMPLFEETAQFGLDRAIDTLLGINTETLSGIWKNAMETYYEPFIDTTEQIIGEKLISRDNSGRLNISPSLSPDGLYLTFFSEKDVFTLDLYLANANTGEIIKKLSTVTRNHEIDDFSFIESGGTWSPDGQNFAFAVFSKGIIKLAVVDIKRSKITDEIEFEGIPSFSNPEWSPDGNRILISGLVDGINNLYIYDLKTKKTSQLTDDFHSNIHPAWSPDGNYIVYATEKINQGDKRKKYSFELNVIDIHTKEIQNLNVFPGADNLNPRFSNDGRNIYFLSNADGYRNLFSYHIETGNVSRLTEYSTGISGITPYSPALTTASQVDLIGYTFYFKGGYEIYVANYSDFEPVPVDKSTVDFKPGTLPPLTHFYTNIVDSMLYHRDKLSASLPLDSINEIPYDPKFKLDYISNSASIGVSSGRYNNNSMAGSVSMIFSDIVGNNQLYSVLALNGEIYDFGGQIAYINQAKRIKWGASVSHIPYRTGNMFIRRDTLTYNNGEDEQVEVPVDDLVLDYIRIFVDNISFFTFHTISQTRRLEGGITAAWYYYRIDRYHNYLDDFGYPFAIRKERRPAPDGNNYQKIDFAYVVDNSYFGMTAPMRGKRTRYQIEKYFGAVEYYAGLLDYRKYWFINPFTMAFRFYHYGRYGKGSESDIISPIYLGYPWLIRGYEDISFYGGGNSPGVGTNTYNVSNLSGSKIVVSNVEFRLPLSGPESLALIKSKYFLVDFNLFFDAGVAWTNEDKPTLEWVSDPFNKRVPVFSSGLSLRVNLLGYVIVEPYYAVPFQNGGWSNKNFGINLVPGW